MDQERNQQEDMIDTDDDSDEFHEGVRGLTLATTTDDGVKYSIEFNSKGDIVPISIRNKVIKWQGTLAKLGVPLSTYKKWTEVSDTIKSDLWKHFKKKFDVDSSYRKKCLQAIGNSWKNWKNRLTTRFILPSKENPELLKKPPYRFMKLHDWSFFVKSRMTEKFQELRNLQSERRNSNKYNHMLSRKGYAGLPEDIEKQFGPSYDVDRSELWLLARQDSNGQFLNDSTREVAEKIGQVRKDVKDGIVVVEGKNDILTLSLGTPEHDGRVRGAGKNFTPTNFFDIPRRVSKKKELEAENLDLKARLKMLESLLLEKGVESPHLENTASNSAKSDNRKRKYAPVDEHLYGMNKKTSHDVSYKAKNTKCKQRNDGDVATSKKSKEKSQYRKGAVNIALKDGGRVVSTGQLSNIHQSNKQVQQCSLALGSITNIVAKGEVFSKMGPNETLHTVPLGDKNFRVSIVIPIKKSALLPFPFDEYKTVGGAKGVPLAWPKEFVIVEDAHLNEENYLEPVGDQGARIPSNKRLVANIKKPENLKDGGQTKQLSKTHQSNKQIQQCSLAMGLTTNIVARGEVFPSMGPNETLHTIPLGDKNLRVSIVIPVQKATLLPFPFDEYRTVGGAVGVPLAWPKEFVIVESEHLDEDVAINVDEHEVEEDENQEEQDEHGGDNETLKEFANLVKGITKIDELYPMDKGVFERDTQFFISKDEVLDVCNFKHQTVNCIIAYIGYLHETYEKSRESYGFCFPLDSSQFGKKDPKKKNHYLLKKNELPMIIKDRLRSRRANQAIFIPYNTGIYWVLAMIDMNAKEIYFFSSLRESKEPPWGLTVIVQAAMVHLSSDESRRFSLTWKPVQCPKQVEAFEGGYYVMRFMKHFIENPDIPMKTKLSELASIKTYTNEELAITRLELVTFIMSWIST